MKAKFLQQLLMVVCVLVLGLSYAEPSLATSAGNKGSISEILGKGLINEKDSTFNDAKLQTSITKIVGVVRLVGAGICFIMIVISGILFSTSGQNQQRRTGAFASLIGVAVGIFCIMQASMIASWFASIGT
ncbi:pilin [Brevibacillus reuszeri]|uniref:pilin n=1 Tax=Brevibacillus reuszeri TaxID=54915 RepID=UPI000CCC49A0|nr:pilin [Brevibacillus reuszeri]